MYCWFVYAALCMCPYTITNLHLYHCYPNTLSTSIFHPKWVRLRRFFFSLPTASPARRYFFQYLTAGPGRTAIATALRLPSLRPFFFFSLYAFRTGRPSTAILIYGKRRRWCINYIGSLRSVRKRRLNAENVESGLQVCWGYQLRYIVSSVENFRDSTAISGSDYILAVYPVK